MTYPYGMYNAPTIGNGLGGLPKAQLIAPRTSTFSRIVTAGAGVLTPPVNAIYMRVAVIGGGGGGRTGTTTQAGSGGGCAASKIVPASVIVYSIGAGGLADPTLNVGGTSTANFSSYFLSATGGTGLATAGGVGSGGDYNFSGGSVTAATSTTYAARGGGGGAGPNGNGGDGAFSSGSQVSGQVGVLSNTGWGAGGGAGGSAFSNGSSTSQARGGAGAGGSTIPFPVSAGSIATIDQTQGGTPFGYSSAWAGQASAGAGGEMGGGGASQRDTGTTCGAGGSGGMIVEWFYI